MMPIGADYILNKDGTFSREGEEEFSCHILLVEDSDMDADVFKRICSRASGAYSLDWVLSGEEALEKLLTHYSDYDAVVSDIGLPGMSGLDLFARLQDEHISLPFIVLTGAGSEEVAIDALRLGVSNYCRKEGDANYRKLLPFVIHQAVQKKRDGDALEKAESDLQEQTRRVELADRAKVQFMQNISHELRTPLNCVVGFSDALKSGLCGELEGKVKDYINDINSAGLHLRTLIDELLDIADIESGNIRPTPELVSVPKSIQDAVKAVEGAAKTKAQSLEVDVPENVPNTLVDPRHLRQVLINILSNSVSYSQRQAEIGVSVEVSNSIYVTLQDNGPGIPADNQINLFEPFSRSQDSLLSASGGMGLGLSIVKALATENEIGIALESSPETGTCITLSLPIHKAN